MVATQLNPLDFIFTFDTYVSVIQQILKQNNNTENRNITFRSRISKYQDRKYNENVFETLFPKSNFRNFRKVHLIGYKYTDLGLKYKAKIF